LTAEYEKTDDESAKLHRLVVLFEESVLKSETCNGATSQGGKEVNPNLGVDLKN
jgi:hypothetical protein